MHHILESSKTSQNPDRSTSTTKRQRQSPDPEILSGAKYPDPPDLTSYIVKVEDQSSDRGAYGDVYRCLLHGQEVAVKTLRFYPSDEPEDARDGFNKAMFRRELGIWKRLEHVNIVPFLGIARDFQWKGSVSLVSSWMPNESLRKFLTKHDDKLGTGHRLNILHDIAKGLNYLHSFEIPIVHGDLNPCNVLLDVYYTARLADFGYSSLAGNTPQALTYLQRFTTGPGALRWSAPEQHDPDWESGLTVKSDIYSFGCVCLQVLSGQHPWSEVPTNHRTMTIIQARLRDQKNPARPSSHEIDDSHWVLIERCWSPLQQRPGADQVVASIDRFIRQCQQPGRIRDLFILSSPNRLHSRANQSSLSVLSQSKVPDGSSQDPGTTTQPRILDSTKDPGVDTVTTRTDNDVSMDPSRIPEVVPTSEESQTGPEPDDDEAKTDSLVGEDSTMAKMDDLSKREDVVIAVMGPTGSGKSTFISTASGLPVDANGIGHSLKSCASEVLATKFFDEESRRNVVLVDTPGFDDTYKSDLDILTMISKWLNSSYSKKELLSGILYLHRITDNRMAGTPLKNLRVFQKLCGNNAMDKVYLVTTMWDGVDEEVGAGMLEELCAKYWKPMINRGARIARCKSDADPPKKLISDIIFHDEQRKALQLQIEMGEGNKELKETAAGQELFSQLEQSVKRQSKILQKIAREKKAAASDPVLLKELQQEYNELREQIDAELGQMQQLKLPWLKNPLRKVSTLTS